MFLLSLKEEGSLELSQPRKGVILLSDLKRVGKSYVFGGLRVQLVREEDWISYSERPLMSNPARAAQVLEERLKPNELDREIFSIALLSVRHKLIDIHQVSVGCLSSSLVHPREVFKVAVLAGAAGLVLCHNHPSGDPEPSADDIALTRRLSSGGALLGIEVLDHVVLGHDGRFVSLKDRGIL